MSINGISNADSILALLTQSRAGAPSGPGGVAAAGSSGPRSFSATLAAFVAEFQSQALSSMTSSSVAADNGGSATSLGQLLASLSPAIGAQRPLGSAAGIGGLSPTGRNMALFDPESAYRMMSIINNRDVAYRAQFAELSQMQAYLAQMRQHGQSLGQVSVATGNDSIKSRLQEFVGQYNDWIQRFDADMQSGGILAGNRAAQVSRYELEQSIANIFHGIGSDVHGLRDLGLTIDADTGLAILDSARLDSMLAGNKQGTIEALREFSASFAKSAELLNSDGNFISSRLSNLSSVIDYIGTNKPALQLEFGLGDPARPTGHLAEALAAYNQTYES